MFYKSTRVAASLVQIYYKESQLPSLYDFSTPYFNEGLTIFFENDPISKVVMSTEAEKIGVCSWKLKDKVRSNVSAARKLSLEVINGDYEVLSLTRNSSRHQMIAMATQWHKDFLPAIDMLWNKLGFKRPGEARTPIYQNAFCATREIYQDYVTRFLNPAMELINTDPELNEIMLRPSNYSNLDKSADIEAVREKLGLNEYPMCPFVLERCPSLWFQLNRVNVSYL